MSLNSNIYLQILGNDKPAGCDVAVTLHSLQAFEGVRKY